MLEWRGRARRRFGIQAQRRHIDTTSFSVSGDYTNQEEGEPVVLAITYGYSRDHREDLKQWMRALATTHDEDLPIFLRPLDSNSADKEHLSATWPPTSWTSNAFVMSTSSSPKQRQGERNMHQNATFAMISTQCPQPDSP